MTGMEWVVLYWSGVKKEVRFRTERDAMKFVMRLPSHTKLYVDYVNVGDEVRVR